MKRSAAYGKAMRQRGAALAQGLLALRFRRPGRRRAVELVAELP
jgi:hypothetical protein